MLSECVPVVGNKTSVPELYLEPVCESMYSLDRHVSVPHFAPSVAMVGSSDNDMSLFSASRSRETRLSHL